MSRICFTLVACIAPCILFVRVTPVRGDETSSKIDLATAQRKGRQAVERGLVFLEKDVTKWRQDHGCALRTVSEKGV